MPKGTTSTCLGRISKVELMEKKYYSGIANGRVVTKEFDTHKI